MSKITDYIPKRQQELTQTLEPLLDQRAKLEVEIANILKELDSLKEAAKAIGLPLNVPDLPPRVSPRKEPTPTIKEAVIAVLRDHQRGLLALEILEKINQRYGLGIVRTSLSPQLSRLKAEFKITNRGSVWMLNNQRTTPD